MVLRQPIIQIRLQFLQVGVELLAKGRGVELFLDGAMEAPKCRSSAGAELWCRCGRCSPPLGTVHARGARAGRSIRCRDR
jgi:hypothetical protein